MSLANKSGDRLERERDEEQRQEVECEFHQAQDDDERQKQEAWLREIPSLDEAPRERDKPPPARVIDLIGESQGQDAWPQVIDLTKDDGDEEEQQEEEEDQEQEDQEGEKDASWAHDLRQRAPKRRRRTARMSF